MKNIFVIGISVKKFSQNKENLFHSIEEFVKRKRIKRKFGPWVQKHENWGDEDKRKKQEIISLGKVRKY